MLNEIYNEDCIQGMMKIPDRSVDLILCDLPYGGAIKKGGVQWDEKIDLNAFWKEYKRVIKQGGNILFFASLSQMVIVCVSPNFPFSLNSDTEIYTPFAPLFVV